MSSKPRDAKAEVVDETPEWVRKTLPYDFEKELIQNQNKRFDINDEFIVIHNVFPLEAKFHARHEQTPPHYAKFLEATERTQCKRRARNNYPRLESQVYGWLPSGAGLGVADLKELNFINAPKQRCYMTVYDEKRINERVTERPGFNGLRFFLR